MALPKSMRYLAGATICVFIFVFVQLLRAPPAGGLQVPSKVPLSKEGDWDESQLDRKSALRPQYEQGRKADIHSQHPENPQSLCDESMETTTPRTTRTAHASTLHF